MDIERARAENCLCDQEGSRHACVVIQGGEKPSADQVIDFAQRHGATCDDYFIFRFFGCCEDIVSEEGLREAIARIH